MYNRHNVKSLGNVKFEIVRAWLVQLASLAYILLVVQPPQLLLGHFSQRVGVKFVCWSLMFAVEVPIRGTVHRTSSNGPLPRRRLRGDWPTDRWGGHPCTST